MTFVVPNAGEVQYSQELIPNLLNGTFLVRLFASDITPSNGQASSVYTNAEPTFAGYSERDLLWQGAPTIVSGAAERISVPLVWQCTMSGSPETIYGYFTQIFAGSFHVFAAERFGSPIVITDVGDKVEFCLKMSVASVG